MMLYVNDPSITDIGYRDFLAGLSAVLCAIIKTRPDWFSLAMVFTGPVALCSFILHALEMNWYKFYKNNHYKRVKNSFYFIYPIAIVILAYGYDYEFLKNASVFFADG